MALPLTIGYLGVERYGVFVALTSLMSMLVFADLGLGNGLLNLISNANGRDDPTAARAAVSSAFVMLLAVAAVGAVISLGVFLVVPWATFLPVSNSAIAAEVAPTVAVLLVMFLVALPLGVVERVRMGYQESYLTSLISISSGLLGIIGLLVAIRLGATLPVLVAVLSLPSLASLAVNGLELFGRRRPWLAPSWRRADRRVAVRLAKVGFLFLILQLTVAVAYQSDVVVAGMVLGPAAAATYSVTLKFFLLVPSLVGIFLMTLWPAYTEALARGDAVWVRQTLKRSITVAAVVSGAASLTLVVAGAWIIRTWTGGSINPPIELLIGAALWAVVGASFNSVAMLLNAASVVRFQVLVAGFMAIASITLSVVFANAFGLAGIIWGTLVAYVLCSAVPMVVFLPRVLRTIERAASDSYATSHGPAHE